MSESPRYYVRNPIMIGGIAGVKVAGYDDGRGVPYRVDRGHVVSIADYQKPVLAKWLRNRCLELYDPKRHKDAILERVDEGEAVSLAQLEAEEQARAKAEEEAADEAAFDQSKPVSAASEDGITSDEDEAMPVAAAKKSNQSSPIAEGTKKTNKK